MISLILLVLIQIINLNRVMASDMASDEKGLDKFVDMIEQNELQIHNGIASGQYDAEDKREYEEPDEDNYGKLLLQDMANFRLVKVPGVDFDLNPESPVEVHDVNEIDAEARPQQEGPPPPEENTEVPSEGPPNVESGDSQPINYSPESPPALHPREYVHEGPPEGPPEEPPEGPPENLPEGRPPPNENISVEPHSGDPSIDIDHHHHHHHHHHLNSNEDEPNFEVEPQNPIKENIKMNENIPENNGNKMIEYGEQERYPLPPTIHSSYEDSANLRKNRHMDDSHSGTLPHSHPIEKKEKANDEHYHNDHHNDEHNDYHDHNDDHHHNHHSHNDESPPESHLHPNEDPNHDHTKDPPISDPNDNTPEQPQNYETLIPQKEEQVTHEEDPHHDQQPIDYNQIPLPLLPAVEPNIDSEHKHDDNNQQNHPDTQSKPSLPGVGGRAEQIMKYYEDQSKVDSKRFTHLTESAPKQNKNDLKLVKRENSKRFENYKNTNEPQIIDENKQINKRMGLSSDPHSYKTERKGHYHPINPKKPFLQYNPGPTTGSREYRKSQEYHSYEPNTPMNEEEVPSDELRRFYDQWADQQIKFSEDKYKTDDHLVHPKSSVSGNDHNRHHNKDDTHSHQKSRSLSVKDFESSRPTNVGKSQPSNSRNAFAQQNRPSSHHQHHHHHQEKPKHPYQAEDSVDEEAEHYPEADDHEDHEDHYEHETQPEERPSNPRHPINRSPRLQQRPVNEEDFHSERHHRRELSPHKNYNKRNDDNSNEKVDNFEQSSAKLDALIPQNMSGMADNYQDYDNQNGQEINDNENPEQSRSEDESHQSSPRDMEDDQQEYETHRKRQRSQHSPHKQHSQLSQRSHRSDPPYNSDKTSNEYNNQNNERNADYYSQNTNSRYGEQNGRSVANQRSNDKYYDKNNERKPIQYSQRYAKEEPRIRPYSGRRQQYYDEEKAATADTSAQKAHPNTGALVSDESQKVLTQTNSSVNSTNNNQTLAIKSIDSFSSWTKPLILKTRLMVFDDKNETQVLEKNESNNTNKKEERVKQRTVESKRRDSRNITRKPKIETKITEKNIINSVNISNKNQTHDMIINPNNKSEYQSKPSNPKTINQQMVRTVRTRPQRSIADNVINFENSPHHSNDDQFSQNSSNSWYHLPNIWTHQRNHSFESSITQPKCVQKSLIKNFCVELDEEYPLESIRRNLIRNLENLRSVHRRLNSSVTNDRYYEDSTDSLNKSCRAHKLTIRPLRAKNINGEWKVVANIDDLFDQTITLTNCSEEHKECQTNGHKFITKCVQKYTLNDLITYNAESSDFEIDIFVVPNMCSCTATKTNII